jgi:hypothetical protein
MDTLTCFRILRKKNNEEQLIFKKDKLLNSNFARNLEDNDNYLNSINLENNNSINKKLSNYDNFLLENKKLLDNINIIINCNDFEDLLLCNNQLFINKNKYYKSIYNFYYKDIYKLLFFIEYLYNKLYSIIVNIIYNMDIDQRNMILNHIKNLLYNSEIFFEKIITFVYEDMIINKIDKILIDLILNLSYIVGILNKNIII